MLFEFLRSRILLVRQYIRRKLLRMSRIILLFIFFFFLNEIETISGKIHQMSTKRRLSTAIQADGLCPGTSGESLLAPLQRLLCIISGKELGAPAGLCETHL